MGTVGDWLETLDAMYPPAWAEDWDNPGLQVGDRTTDVERILVALDPTVEVIREAADQRVQLLVTHHPLVLEPLARLDLARPVDAAIAEALAAGLAVIACHTNADVADPGVSDVLASALDVTVERPLVPTHAGASVKLVTFVPPASAHKVLEALARAGAGVIGEYDVCSFRAPGTGTSRPSAQARPKRRKKVVNEVEEERLEMIVRRDRIGPAVDALLEAHPSKSPTYDIIATETPSGGLGRIGSLEGDVPARELADRCAERLGARPRLVGGAHRRVVRVAVCGGSGASLLSEAVAAGADAFVTGDVKHHAALDAVAAGIAVIDAGHHATEWPFVPHLAERLAEAGGDVLVSEVSTDPFEVVG